ncbi:CotH kinase family protein [Haloferula sargassicola]|uniref:LTD domain-containing protein n=1 Tax=Haloferula sargassicola TaxID=490096 RepID=A0ABP9UVU8_9BACT
MTSRFLKIFALLMAGCWAGLPMVHAGVFYRYYRFSTERVRTGFNNSVQLGDFHFYTETGEVAEFPWITNPGGDNPDGEGPYNLVDDDPSTKWLDFNRAPLVFDFFEPVEIDHYGFTTANDATGRDPVRWTFEGSNNGSNWTLLDDRGGENQDVSTARYFTHQWEFNALPDKPEVEFSVSGGGAVSDKAVNVPSNGTATLTWDVTGATHVEVTRGIVIIASSDSGALEVSPAGTTNYSVTAENAAGTTTRQLTVYVGQPVEDVVIHEFVADATEDGGVLDEDREPSDWIELHNPNPFAVPLEGYGLTDDETLATVWLFPAGSTIDPDEYLVVFASGKNRAVAGAEYHTDFQLSKSGEYLALTDSEGGVVQAFEPAFPEMFEDVSYGVVPPENGGGLDYFTIPTPGAANDTLPGAPGALVEFITPPGTFTTSTQVELATAAPLAEIRYTTDGQNPDAGSTLYTGPIPITATTMVKARTFEAGHAPGEVAAETFVQLDGSLGSFSSDLPVVVVENFNAGAVPSDQTLQPAQLSLFEPDPVTGRTSLDSLPTDSHRCGIKRRGSSTLNNPKGNYRVEFWQDGSEEEKKVRLLGLSEHDEWVLYAPYYYDRSLIRNAFLFGLSNDIGDWAPRTRFCEVYLNTDGGPVTAGDYQGVYVLMERISRDGDRVDIDRLAASDNAAPEVTGGYILSIDRPDPEDQGFRSALGHPFDPPNANPQPFFNHVYPKEQNITPEQSSYIRGYIDDMEAALYGSNFTDPETGYRAWLDTAPTIDHHLMVTFSKDPDGLRLSTYLYKPRLGKLAFGPLWDFDRSMGPDGDDRAESPQGWDPKPERAEFFGYDYWGRLFEDPDFMQEWIDRWQELRRGPFADAAMQARVDQMAAELEESQVRNAQRWPNVAPNGGDLTTLGGYDGEIDHLKNWMFQRAAWIDSQFVAPPVISPGGQVAAGTVVTAQPVGGTLWYTLDGSDPRLPGGAVNPAAVSIDGGAVETVLFDEASGQVEVLRPTSGSPGTTAWTVPGFDATGWITGNFGVGYETGSGYQSYLSTIVHNGSGGAPTSVYVRVPFEVSLPGSGYDSLTLRVRYDDGFVAYLNGTRVLTVNAPASLGWNSAAPDTHSDSQAVNLIDFDLSAYSNLLVDGPNLLAIHALNDGTANSTNTGSSSSDMLLSAEMTATYTATGSGDLVIDDTTRVIARSLFEGQWSGPVNATYVVGKPATAANLVVSEIMYHPTNPTPEEESAGYLDDGDFEFLELQNISNDTIDLSGVVISDCFDFDFTGAEITLLPPGGCVLVVRNRTAAELRYGSGLPIAGAWGDPNAADGGSNLSNGGERIIVTAADGSPIRDFEYDDKAPWPVEPDGDGPSLELISPFTSPDHAVATNWRSSADSNGTPGTGQGVFETWAASHFSETQLADPAVSGPAADPDGDGLVNSVELVFGGDPLIASPGLLPAAALEEIEVGGETDVYLTLTFTRDPSVPGYSSQPQFSSSLGAWSTGGVLVATGVNPDGTETVTYRDPTPAPAGRRFARVLVSGSL